MTRISKELYERLMRDGVHGTGANQGHAGIKAPVSSPKALNGVSMAGTPGGEEQRPTAGGGKPADLKMLMKLGRVVRARPILISIDGGKLA